MFFLDPHDDAIDDLIGRIPPHRLRDVIFLSPMDETHSFAINLLACQNIHSWTEREHAYTRAKGVFDKLWRNTIVEVPWLQLIIEYTLPLFIQNQDHTLAEVPIFLTDREFRDHLLGNVSYDMDIVRFWRHEFHQKQADAAITRVRMLLGRPPVKHIVSQRETTLNFARLINEKRIVLFKLPASLAIDTKTFIGLILINELVHAVRQRRAGDRQQFCVFVDEFQHFANADDFATLINEGRKFGIATTVAHQERVGQFADDKKILGATDAAGNKIFFQLSVADAQEQAREFAKPPPTETRREQELTVSPTPVSDLLNRGHTNPAIRAFAAKYLRHMHERWEDAKEDMEGERLRRMAYLDQAGLYAVDERLESLESNDRLVRRHIIEQRGRVLERAQAQTGVLLNLFDAAKGLRRSLRGLDRFLTGVMEGAIAPGQEAFSDFLIALVHDFSGVAKEHAHALELYIALSYGDHRIPRTIIYEFAAAHGLFSRELAVLVEEAERKTKVKRASFREAFIAERVKWKAESRQG